MTRVHNQQLVRDSVRTVVVGLGIFTVLLIARLSTQAVFAQNMSSPGYNIQMGTFNITSGTKTGGGMTLTDSVGQTAPGQFGTGSEPSRVLSGFQYMYTIGKFTFKILNAVGPSGQSSLSLGTTTPGVFSEGEFRLQVSARGANGYTVTTYQNGPLTNPLNSEIIPNTTCDAGCTYGTATAWTNPANIGFGYRVSGTDVPSVFSSNPTFYKPFADLSLDQPPQVVMNNTGAVRNHEATVSLRVSIPGDQPAGEYENSLVFIATPGY